MEGCGRRTSKQGCMYLLDGPSGYRPSQSIQEQHSHSENTEQSACAMSTMAARPIACTGSVAVVKHSKSHPDYKGVFVSVGWLYTRTWDLVEISIHAEYEIQAAEAVIFFYLWAQGSHMCSTNT